MMPNEDLSRSESFDRPEFRISNLTESVWALAKNHVQKYLPAGAIRKSIHPLNCSFSGAARQTLLCFCTIPRVTIYELFQKIRITFDT
jgi:hypothetical protein